jgi:DNA-binding MarR family transcriptional regulator
MHMDEGPDDARRAATSAVMEQTFALVRLVGGLKAQGHDRSARLLLFPLGACGPVRQSALAELSHTDPSTISRHVADLVAQGLVERLPDPADGRASLLALTAEGEQALEAMRRRREERASEALSGWSTPEIAAFTASMARYTHDLTALLLTPPAGSPQLSRTPVPAHPPVQED